ncbi:MAG TPA: class I SAM-dependent methyltransferase [Longimicrobiaceae bacterium]|nr:class I SAM-dependent methyltransferase [Longimicrobiaceae bacterium]
MRRIHAFELEDQPWLPRVIRDYATDFLQFMLERGEAYGPTAPLIARALETCGTHRIVDIGSGGGGPWFRLLEQVEAERPGAEVLLTDRYPSREAIERVRRRSGDRLRYHSDPVDAMRMPEELVGFRTLFTALHHFRPEEVRAILGDAVRKGQGIGAFEFSERSARGVLMTVVSPLLVLLVTPWIRPFRWSRLLWTYLVPVVPLVVLWDGVVSSLRSYTPQEMEAMARGAGGEDYRWEVGQVRGRAPIPVTYLLGWPTPARHASSPSAGGSAAEATELAPGTGVQAPGPGAYGP